jgi:ferredoxin
MDPMKPLKIIIDRDTCAACDICRETAPGTFEIDAQAKAAVKDPEGDPRDVILAAAEGCPMSAISVWDGDTGAQLVPRP